MYGGILPAKQEHENMYSYMLFSKAFTALFYSPTMLWGTVCSRSIFLLSGFNFREKILFDRCVYSAYRDVLQLHLAFQGPLIPIPKELLDDKNCYYDFGWLLSLDFFRKHKSSNYPVPKEFHTYDLDKMDGYHFSSNIPNFVVTVSLAILLYELNEHQYSTEKHMYFPVSENSYILRSNARELKKLFCLSDDVEDIIPQPNINDKRNPEYEKEFRKIKRKTGFNNPIDVCYLQSLQLKLAFVKPFESRSKGSKIDTSCKWMTIGELALDLFSKKYDPSHPFYKLDPTFMGIVRYLSNPENMIEIMMSPKTVLEKISGKPTNAKGKKEMLEKICEIVGCPVPAKGGVGNKGQAGAGNNSGNMIAKSRPKAYCFNANEKKLFKNIYRYRMENSKNQDEKDPVHENNMTLLNMANLFAEKMVTCIATLKLHNVAKPNKCISEKVLKNIDSGIYGRNNVYSDAASRVVQHVYQSHFNKKYEDQVKNIYESIKEEEFEDGTIDLAEIRFESLMMAAFQGEEFMGEKVIFPLEVDACAKSASIETVMSNETFDMLQVLETMSETKGK